MNLAVVDVARLRLAQAATDGPWKPGSATPTIHHVIRLEPSGRAVGTNRVTLVVAELAVEPFDGEPVHLIPESVIPKAAKTAKIEGDTLVTDKGSVALRWVREDTYPPLTPYYNYEPVLERVSRGDLHPRGDYGWDHRRLHNLLSAHPTWPKEPYFRLRHLSEMSVQIEMEMEGVTALLSLASKAHR
jgi:hypothetical protein